jgi:hypothetical protein
MKILLLNNSGDIDVLATSQGHISLRTLAEKHAKENFPKGQFKWVDPSTYNDTSLNETIINYEIHRCEVTIR